MSRIDAPLLNTVHLEFLYRPIYDIPQLPLFMLPKETFKLPLKIGASAYDDNVSIVVSSSSGGYFYLRFPCTGLYRQVSLLSHIFTQCSPLLSHVYRLDLYVSEKCDLQLDERASMPWLKLLRSFDAVQILYISSPALPGQYDNLEIDIARVLGNLTSERAAEVLPMMHTLLLRRFNQVGYLMTRLLKPFVNARQLSGQPVEVR